MSKKMLNKVMIFAAFVQVIFNLIFTSAWATGKFPPPNFTLLDLMGNLYCPDDIPAFRQEWKLVGQGIGIITGFSQSVQITDNLAYLNGGGGLVPPHFKPLTEKPVILSKDPANRRYFSGLDETFFQDPPVYVGYKYIFDTADFIPLTEDFADKVANAPTYSFYIIRRALNEFGPGDVQLVPTQEMEDAVWSHRRESKLKFGLVTLRFLPEYGGSMEQFFAGELDPDILEAANGGFALAQQLAGQYFKHQYLEAEAPNENQHFLRRSLEYFEKAAFQGDRSARYLYATTVLDETLGIIENREKAEEYLRILAEEGDLTVAKIDYARYLSQFSGSRGGASPEVVRLKHLQGRQKYEELIINIHEIVPQALADTEGEEFVEKDVSELEGEIYREYAEVLLSSGARPSGRSAELDHIDAERFFRLAAMRGDEIAAEAYCDLLQEKSRTVGALELPFIGNELRLLASSFQEPRFQQAYTDFLTLLRTHSSERE